MCATLPKPGRTMRVAQTIYPGSYLKVIVKEGRKTDLYTVFTDSFLVHWHHAIDATRTHRVTVGDNGLSLCCNCKGATLGRRICRHMSATDALLAHGRLTILDQLETPADIAADAEARDSYYDSLELGVLL